MTSWPQKIHPELNHLWRGAWKAGRLEPARYLYDHELVIVQRGSCRVSIEGKTFDLAAGSWIIIPPATNHSTIAGPDGVFRSCIHFNWIPRKTPRPAAVCLFHPKRPKPGQVARAPHFVPKKFLHGKHAKDAPIQSLLETIFFRWKNADALSRQLAWIQFLEIVAHLLMVPSQTETKRRSPVNTAYMARELLESGNSSQSGIQEQLGTLGFSYAHVCRLFHRAFGMTPTEYRNVLRLERAKALLRDPRQTIAEIAYQVGFDDPTYFTRLFRRHNGIPPSQYR